MRLRVSSVFFEHKMHVTVHAYIYMDTRGRINRRTSNLNYNLNAVIDSLVIEVIAIVKPDTPEVSYQRTVQRRKDNDPSRRERCID